MEQLIILPIDEDILRKKYDASTYVLYPGLVEVPKEFKVHLDNDKVCISMFAAKLDKLGPYGYIDKLLSEAQQTCYLNDKEIAIYLVTEKTKDTIQSLLANYYLTLPNKIAKKMPNSGVVTVRQFTGEGLLYISLCDDTNNYAVTLRELDNEDLYILKSHEPKYKELLYN